MNDHSPQPSSTSVPSDVADDQVTQRLTHVPNRSPVVGKSPLRLEGQQIGSYLVEEEIGRGAMGQVFRALHTRLKRRVALKILPLDSTISPRQLMRFQREMEAIGKMDHPNIVRATDAGESNGIHYLAMDLIEGIDVGEFVRHARRVTPECAAEIIRQTAVGLEHIRECGLVHRDIKPSNLLLTADGQIKILDLGIARLRCDTDGSAVTAEHAFMGTPDYIAPEQANHAAEVDIRADIYSLGCTFYTLLAGKAPFDDGRHTTHLAKVLAHAQYQPTAINSLVENVPTALVSILDRMMAKSPDDRFQTPREVAEALADCANFDGLRSLCHTYVTPNVNATRGAQAVKLTPLRGRGSAGGHAPIAICVITVVACIAWFVGTQALSPAKTTHSSSATATKLTSTISVPEPSHSEVDSAVTAQQVQKTTQQIASASEQIASNTARMANTLDSMQATFQSLARSGGLIDSPGSAPEYYHNARILESLGRIEQARGVYEQLLATSTDFIDVHQRYQQVIRQQEGPAGVFHTYQRFAGQHRPVAKLAQALAADASQRDQRIAELAADEPNFAPAAYEWSRTVSAATLGEQSLVDKALEKRALEQFFAQVRHGEFQKYYLDPTVAASIVEDAEARYALLKSFDPTAADHPVSFAVSRSGHNWNLSIQVRETPREIFVRSIPDQPFASTGFTTQVDPRTQRPYPMTLVSLPETTAQGNIDIEYVDIRGVRRGPFSIPFDPAQAMLDIAKRELSQRPLTWARFGQGEQAGELYFHSLAKYRSAIASVHYAVDSDVPNQLATLPELHQSTTDDTVTRIPATARFVVIRITYRDQSTSDIVRIVRSSDL